MFYSVLAAARKELQSSRPLCSCPTRDETFVGRNAVTCWKLTRTDFLCGCMFDMGAAQATMLVPADVFTAGVCVAGRAGDHLPFHSQGPGRGAACTPLPALLGPQALHWARFSMAVTL